MLKKEKMRNLPREAMTSPREESDLLMLTISLKASPVDPDLSTLSDPAKSTNDKVALTCSFVIVFIPKTLIWKTE